jgi:hypothetical protein
MTADLIREAVARALAKANLPWYNDFTATPDYTDEDAERVIAALEASGIKLVRMSDAGLGEAWRAVEEALPTFDWRMSLRQDDDSQRWEAAAVSSSFFDGANDDEVQVGVGATPEAALRALAARLAEHGEPRRG